LNTLILEETEQGEMVSDVYQRLAQDRILFIHEYIDDKVASDICATLLLKNAEDKENKITLFINSEGGDIRSTFMIYDVINIIDSPIETICAGSAWDEVLLLLAAGTKGMRFATQNSVICASQLMYNKMHFSDLTDARIIKDIIKNDNKKMLEAFASITGKTYSTIVEDFNDKKFMTPAQAKKYGLIDGIIKNKK
jgi:ATP-dependent Clp protease protease subunit